ncbi:zinc-ribbon domain-containing protein [[Ruminococcus] lactaris]|nr:zinc-ribbon domain-containing protein [[Ruminococcus] lactaris]
MNNSLAEVHPELVSEWSEKNLPLTPDDITFGSNKKVWWKGACGHEWQTSVKARSNGEKCPICSGARVIAGINDLATLEPLLAKQWSKKNKIKPTEVSIGSHKKVIWRCEKGHEWEAAVKSRTINKTGCPYCSHNKVLAGFNDLATLLPDIAAEWSDRNYPLLPINPKIEIEGILLTMCEARTNLCKVISEQMADSFDGKIRIFKSKIPNTVKVGESVYYSEPLLEYAPDTKACKAYLDFGRELIANES